jgi:ubiquinone/menaquinone biosynthesis C-methylase UbiE
MLSAKHRCHGVTGNAYPLPNDGEEVNRLDELHIMYRHLMGRNIIVPMINKPTGILDVGTGSGRWVVEVAEKYPSATVWGLDLSPASPLYEPPPNCEFLVGDLTHGFDFDDGTLDLVHSRYVPCSTC